MNLTLLRELIQVLYALWCNPRFKSKLKGYVTCSCQAQVELLMRQHLHTQAIQMEGSKGKTAGWSLKTKLVIGVIYFLVIGQHY